MKRKFRVAKEVDLYKMKSSQVDAFFIGLILGDGCIRKNGDFNFSNTNKNLVDYVEKIIRTSTEFKLTRQYFKGKFRQGYQENDMYTLDIYSQKKYFLKIRKYMYDDTGRIVTDKLLNKLQLHSLAFWYMGDGCLTRSGITKGKIYKRIPSICTHGYTKEENERMMRWFDESLGIDVRVNKQGKYYHLRFPVRESQKFFKIIFPYMLTDFYYKIDLVYPEKTLDKNITPEFRKEYDIIKTYRSQDVWEKI